MTICGCGKKKNKEPKPPKKEKKSKNKNQKYQSTGNLNDQTGGTFHTSAIVRRPVEYYDRRPATPTPMPMPQPQPSYRPVAPSPAPSGRCPIHHNLDYLNLVETGSRNGNRQSYLPELEGDIEALSLIDLDRYGLSEYKYLVNQRYNNSGRYPSGTATAYNPGYNTQTNYNPGYSPAAFHSPSQSNLAPGAGGLSYY